MVREEFDRRYKELQNMPRKKKKKAKYLLYKEDMQYFYREYMFEVVTKFFTDRAKL